jgi:hypothetical protein
LFHGWLRLRLRPNALRYSDTAAFPVELAAWREGNC